MNPWVILLPFFALHTTALANTEIINFSAPKSNEVYIAEAARWPALHYEENQRQWRLRPALLGTPLELVCEPSLLELSDSHSSGSDSGSHPRACPDELWVILELAHEGWKAYSKFTLRISWPASFPTDFSIQVYDPEALLTRFNASRIDTFDVNTTTRRKYARIRLVDTGIRTPGPHSSNNHKPTESAATPFIVILEPLYFGVLPASVVPTVLLLVPVMVIAALVVPSINTYLEGVARQARREIVSPCKEE